MPTTWDRSDAFDGYSIEVTARGVTKLADAVAVLPAPDAVFIPYLTDESDADRLAAAVAARQLGFTPVTHIAARRIHSAEALDRFVGALADRAQVDRLFLIAGDPARAAGPYADTLSVIRSGVLGAHGITAIGIGGHPEGHAQVDDETLWQALADKTRAARELGLTCEIVTQFAFDPAPVLTWLAELRRRGIDVPVRLGVAGPASARTLLKYAAVCGVGASGAALAKYGLSLGRLLRKSAPDGFVDGLTAALDPARHGVVHLHLFPFGGLSEAATWLSTYRTPQRRCA